MSNTPKLKLEDKETIKQGGKEIIRYVFSDDKVVRIDADTDEIITDKVPQKYLDLISDDQARRILDDDEGKGEVVEEDEVVVDDDIEDDGLGDDIEETDESDEENESDDDYDEDTDESKIAAIRSGTGAGLGVFCGVLLHFTIIGPLIAGFLSFNFLNEISDRDYLENTDVKTINFRKGFYATGVFGWLPAIICCQQWKTDMISVLCGTPNKYSRNKHSCFKAWFWVEFILDIFYIISAISTPR